MTTNRMIRDMDLGVPITDGRRVEVVADGLPLFGGVQLAIDTTLVSTLHCDGSPRRGAAHTDGVTLDAVRRRKERTYPEFVGPRSKARLVVLVKSGAGDRQKLVRSSRNLSRRNFGANRSSYREGRSKHGECVGQRFWRVQQHAHLSAHCSI